MAKVERSFDAEIEPFQMLGELQAFATRVATPAERKHIERMCAKLTKLVERGHNFSAMKSLQMKRRSADFPRNERGQFLPRTEDEPLPY